MTTSIPSDSIVIVHWSRGRVIGRALRRLILVLILGFMASDARLGAGMCVVLLIGAALIAMGIVGLLTKLVRRRPVLMLDDIGFEAPNLISGRVPWFGIKTMRIAGYRRVSFLVMTLDERTVDELVFTRARRLRLWLRLARRTRLSLDLSLLDRSGPEIARLFDAHRRSAGYRPPIPSDAERHATAAFARHPVFAYTLAALLGAILVGEYHVALRPTGSLGNLDTLTLWSLGASQKLAIVRDGQWWRLVTASLLHGSVVHFLFNGIALSFAARLLERLIGWRWFAASFAVSAVCGSVLSMMWNAPETVGVGASGGILGLSATTAVVAFHFGDGAIRSRLLVGAVQILLPSLLPSVHHGGMNVDIAAHAGGALGGIAMGFLIRGCWDRGAPTPRLGLLGALIAGVYFAIAAASAVPITQAYRTAQAMGALDPTFPRDFNLAIGRAAQLLQAYPRDPRVRAAHAEMLVTQDDIPGAEKDLESALADTPMLAAGVTTSEPYLRVRLAQLLVSEDKTDEATKVVQPACATTVPSLKAAIVQMALCR